MAYNAKAISNYFLELAENKGRSLTPMKLQKMIFFAHGWSLALYKAPLIAEQIEAWPFGPVIPSIYHEFKHVRSGAITSKATEFDLENFELYEPKLDDTLEDQRTKKLLDKIWDVYSIYSAIQLSNLTHLDETPWAKAKANFEGFNNIPIENSIIQKYFEGLVG